MAKFLIQDNLISSKNLHEITRGVQGLPHVKVSVTPFTHEISPDWPLKHKDWIPYGSVTITEIGHKNSWTGCYADLSEFNYQKATDNRKDMLNTGQIIPLVDAIKFFKQQDPRSMWFLRPSEDRKQFVGQTINAMNAHEWLEDAMNCASSGSYQLPAHTPLVISEPKEIYAEWRWFIVDGQVVSGSMYRCHDQLKLERSLDTDLIAEAQCKADGWLPHPCCVMDLALTKKGLFVIEFNTINSSGFYDHDVESIMNRLYAYANK